MKPKVTRAAIDEFMEAVGIVADVPVGEGFTLREIAEAKGITIAEARGRVKRAEAEGRVKLIGKRKRADVYATA